MPNYFFFFFFGGARDGVTLVRNSTAQPISLGRRGFHPTNWGRYTWGNALCTRLLTQGSVGLPPSRRARRPYLFRPGGRLGVLPTKTPGCLHHSLWRLVLSVEHFAQVACTFLVFRAFLSYRKLFVSRQSICILPFICLYQRSRTVSSVWWFWGSSRLAILLSHRSTHIRCIDSVISILYRRFFPASGFPFRFLKFARPPPSIAPSDAGRSCSCRLLHSAFACSHTTLLSVESHSVMMCSKLSFLSHSGQIALPSHPGMWFQKSPSL